MNTAHTTTDVRISADHQPAALRYPEEFLIACGIHRLRPEEFLRQFVNRLRYCGLLCGSQDDTEHAVNEVIFDYLQICGKRGDIEKTDQALHRKWLKKLNTIIERDWKLTEHELEANMGYTLLACRKEICTKREQATQVSTPDGYTIQLPGNFIVMCFMYGVSPEAVLQHLIDNISLAMEAAVNQYGMAGFNPFMNFFHSMSAQFFRDSKELRAAGFYRYDRELVRLYEALQGERDYATRLAALTAHYRAWYKRVQHIPVMPAG